MHVTVDCGCLATTTANHSATLLLSYAVSHIATHLGGLTKGHFTLSLLPLPLPALAKSAVLMQANFLRPIYARSQAHAIVQAKAGPKQPNDYLKALPPMPQIKFQVNFSSAALRGASLSGSAFVCMRARVCPCMGVVAEHVCFHRRYPASVV